MFSDTVDLADVVLLLSSALFKACLSSSVIPGAGRESAEPLPDIRHSARSSGPRPLTRSRILGAGGLLPCRVGNRMGGLDDLDPLQRANAVAITRDHQAGEICLSGGHRASTARAIEAAALPAPTTTVAAPRAAEEGSQAQLCRARRPLSRLKHVPQQPPLIHRLAPPRLFCPLPLTRRVQADAFFSPIS